MNEFRSAIAEAAGDIVVRATIGLIKLIEDHWPYAVSPKPSVRTLATSNVKSTRAA